MKRPKRVAAIHDLSAFGRCSLSVIIPVLSAMGAQVLAVPTALLSSHTGGLDGVYREDCAAFADRCRAQWRALGLGIECVYSGYLGDARRAEQVLAFREAWPEALLLVDPVLGDHGKPYRSVTGELVAQMRRLAAAADVITPNLTEAALLLGEEYRPALTQTEIPALLGRLCALGPRRVAVTGVEIDGRGMCNLCCDAAAGRTHLVACTPYPVRYPGTGDIFAAVVTGALLGGEPLERAVSLAADFVEACIRLTVDSGEPENHGVFLEPALGGLIAGMNASRAESIPFMKAEV